MASSRSTTTNNKYASLNFNHIHQKKHQPSSSSSASSSTSPLTASTAKKVLSNSRIHGNMLVLSRPAPKPIPQPSPPPTPSTPPQQLQQPPTTPPDPISLRPLGRTGSGPALTPSPLTLPKPDREDYSPSPSPSPNSGRFVPPHLRPGFAGREEKPGFQQGGRSRENLVEMNRPGSGGARPSSSGR